MVWTCEQGRCLSVGCEAGYADCDGLSDNGCEVDVRRDASRCGGCDQPCRSGTRFANAEVACVVGECIFLGCWIGFADHNGDCEQDGTCLDGCEACLPLVDGSVEIPDDGEDNDCDGQDSVNSEERGLYVDPSFVFGAECPEPGQGTRGCPFRALVWALEEAQQNGHWEAPDLAKREIYLAAGLYIGQQVAAEITKPIMLLGGYRRTASGPWTRDPRANETVLRAGFGAAVVAASDVEGWAVLDGLVATRRIEVHGSLLARRLRSSGTLDILSTSSEATLWLDASDIDGTIDDSLGVVGWTLTNSTIHGDVRGRSRWTLTGNTVEGELLGGAHWRLAANTIHGNIRCGDWSTLLGNVLLGSLQRNVFSESCTLAGNTIDGDLGGGARWTLTGNTVRGTVRGLHDWTVTGNTFEGDMLYSSGPWTLRDNTIRGDVESGGYWTATGNTIFGDLHVSWGNMVLAGNTILGSVAGSGRSWVLTGNTIYLPVGGSDAAIRMFSEDWQITNNAFVWPGDPAQAGYALVEGNADANPHVVRGNAFIGFGSTPPSLYLNEANSPITDLRHLNTLGDLPECGRGDNIVINDPLDAGFISLQPGAPGFLALRPDSPLVDAGIDLPLLCADLTTEAPATDVTGQPIPCGDAFDIGSHESCPAAQR